MTETEKLKKALDLALKILSPDNSDSRGASPEFVAMAAVACDCADEACMRVIDEALVSPSPQAAPAAFTVACS